MPCQMNRKTRAFAPCRSGFREERQTVARTALHLHHVGDDVNGAWVSWVNSQGAARHFLSATVLTIFLKAKGVHRKHTRVMRRRVIPVGEEPGDTVAQHSPVAQAEIKRMGDHEGENVPRPIDQDGAIALGGDSRIAFQPGLCRRGMTMRRIPWFRAFRQESYAPSQRPSRSDIVGAHDQCNSQAMTEYILGVVSQQPVDFG